MKKFITLLVVLFYLCAIAGVGYIGFKLLNNHEVEANENVEIEQEEVVEEETVEDNNNNDMGTFLGFTIDYVESDSILNNPDDIGLYDVDGSGYTYGFNYNGEYFRAVYNYDTWSIYDSYRVRNSKDMEVICQALIDVHPVLGKDRTSYRTAKDMAYEWLQHNIAYELLPDSEFKASAKDVDLDPDDQGLSLEEIYRKRYQN